MKKKLLYVISKFNESNIINFNAVEIIEENETEYILLDKINNKNNFLKEDLDKEFKFLFVTKDKRKLKKQLKRIYENINKETQEDISDLEYKINQLKEIQERNEQSYSNAVDFLKK